MKLITLLLTILSFTFISASAPSSALGSHCNPSDVHNPGAQNPATDPCINAGDAAKHGYSTFNPSDANNGQKLALNTGFGFSTLGQAINTIISVIFFVAALAAFFYILLGAFTYVTAGDDATKTEKARKSITNAVVGLILVALVYVIWLIVINTVPGIKSFFA